MGAAPSSPEEESTARHPEQTPRVSVHDLLVNQTLKRQSSKPLLLLKQAIRQELGTLLARDDFSLQDLNARTVQVYQRGDATEYGVQPSQPPEPTQSASHLNQAVRRIMKFRGVRVDGAVPLLQDVQAWTVLFYLCGHFWWQLAETEQKQRFERRLRNAIADDVQDANKQAQQWALLGHIGHRLTALAIALRQAPADEQAGEEAEFLTASESEGGEPAQAVGTPAENFLLQASEVLAGLPTKPLELTARFNARKDGAREWLQYVGEAIRLRDAVSQCTSCGGQVDAPPPEGKRNKNKEVDR